MKQLKKVILGLLALLKNPHIKFTINISGSLLEKLEELGQTKLINDIKILIDQQQIELVGTATHHPLLPLLPEAEIINQIKLQENLIKKYFGDIKLQGFFMPEMAYSKESANIIKNLGYDWIILDEISTQTELDNSQFYQDENNGLKVIFRHRQHSQTYVPKLINNLLEQNQDQTIITATDAELYGLRHNDLSRNLEKVLQSKNLNTATISEFLNQGKDFKKINIIPSNWETTKEELNNNLPYALWHNPANKIQSKIIELAKLATEAIYAHQDDPQYEWAQKHLRQGLSSCTLWWASGETLPLWEFVAWNPDQIELGLNELIRSIRTLDNKSTRGIKIKAEKLYNEIKQLVWERHWTEFWKQ